MSRALRVIHSNKTVLTDKTLDLNNFDSGSLVFDYVKTEDYLYLGSYLPFNHFYFDIKTANDVAANCSIEVWWSNAWHSVYDILDGTKTTTKSFATSGLISWSTDNFKGWDRWSRNDTDNGLKALNIFDLYWARMSFSDSLKATTELNFIGHKFSNDTDLYIYYPLFNDANLRTAFQSGKTSWYQQHINAAQEIIRDLRSKGILNQGTQILNTDLFKIASVHKTAELIFKGLGKDYQEDAKAALIDFSRAMNLKFFDIDNNRNANLDEKERYSKQGYFYR